METRAEDLLPRLDPAVPWRDRVRAALYALHRFLAADERAADLLLAELAGAAADADPPVAERWTEYLLDLIDEGREEPTAPALGRMTAEALGGGICTRLYAAVVRDGHLPDEAEIVPELMYCVVLPYCGRDAAREELAISPPPREPSLLDAPR
jgi:hypothetical protein